MVVFYSELKIATNETEYTKQTNSTKNYQSTYLHRAHYQLFTMYYSLM